MSTMRNPLTEISPEVREALLAHSHRVNFPAGSRLIEEHRRADRFWITEYGTVELDMHVPGHKPAVVAVLGAGDLLGWS
ncbi:cyclic nucleotide-binding domain-containing protein [Streptomyces sp. NPDC055400]